MLDYHNGYEDLKDKCLRIIGDPEVRYREDPVRMMRAVRIAAKLGFRIDESDPETNSEDGLSSEKRAGRASL